MMARTEAVTSGREREKIDQKSPIRQVGKDGMLKMTMMPSSEDDSEVTNL